MSPRKFASICLGLLCGVIAQLAAWAQTEPPVRMVYVEFPPYSFTGDSGQAEGLSVDLARALLGDVAIEFTAVETPDVMIERLRTGQADVSSLLGLTPDRLAAADATDTLGAFQSALFAKSGRSGDSIDDFSGQRIGVVTGSIAVKIAQAIPFAKLVEYENPDAQILGLLVDEVDAVVGATDSFTARLRLMGVDRIVSAVDPPLEQYPYAFYVSPARPDLLAGMNGAIAQDLTPEDIATLRAIWFGKPSRNIVGELVFAGVLLSVLLVGVLIAAIVSGRRKSKHIKEVSAQAGASRLLVEAMNAVHSAVVIYDKDLRAVHWNDGFASAFPTLAPLVKDHASLQDMIVKSYELGFVSGPTAASDARAMADDIAQRLLRGESVTRMIRGASGRVFEATELPLGDGFFASLRVDVTRLREQASLIERQKQELEAANDKLQIFATIAAHDLKAPLVQQSAILQAIDEDLQDGDIALPDEVCAYFDMLGTLSDRMRQLIQGLLDHARAEDHRGDVETIDVNARMPAVIGMVGLPDDFHVDVQADLPSLRAVPATFDAVMRNLISNAIKHHDKGRGVIQVRGKQIGDQIVFEVEDDGPGIPEEHLSSIFDPFKRLSNTVDGSGLGLSFIKKTVNLWGGGIYVECRAARGSVFVFSVPAEPRVDLFFQSAAAEAEPAVLH